MGIGSFFKKALTFVGAGVGGYYGGVPGALAGASIAGGPSSTGGITGVRPGQGAESGREARGYYDEAFPGTNPWERLGAGNPMGAAMSAGVAAKTAERNVDKQTQTQKQLVAAQSASQQTVAGIQANAQLTASARQARAAGAATGMNLPPDQRDNLMTKVESGVSAAPATTAPGVMQRGAASKEMEAKAAELNSWTNVHQADLKSRALDIETGARFKNPATAKLAAIATHAFDIGMSQDTFIKWMRDNPKKLASLGIGVAVGGAALKMLGGIFGRVRISKAPPKKTSVRSLGDKRTATATTDPRFGWKPARAKPRGSMHPRLLTGPK